MGLKELYNENEIEWLDQMIELLKQGKFEELDTEHLLEALIDMSERERRTVRSKFIVLIAHLLKYQFQPGKRLHGNSWARTISGKRRELILDFFSGKSRLYWINYYQDEVEKIYKYSVEQAVDETGLNIKIFPKTNPWTLQQILDKDFWPKGDE